MLYLSKQVVAGFELFSFGVTRNYSANCACINLRYWCLLNTFIRTRWTPLYVRFGLGRPQNPQNMFDKLEMFERTRVGWKSNATVLIWMAKMSAR